MQKKILVTGASSGFGNAIARKFAAAGNDLIITGRRAERLEVLAAELRESFGINVIVKVFDVQNREEVFATLHGDPALENLDLLVNNAGLALGRDHFDQGNIDDWETMIDTNLKGLLYVTRAVLPGLISNGKGHIVNIGSTAGTEAYEKGNV